MNGKKSLLSVSSVCLGVLVASLTSDAPIRAQSAPAPGGFIESVTSLTTRALLSASQIAAFLPQRGLFTFPAPYNTLGVRLTNAGDCGGSDCVLPVGYSYWRTMNNHAGSDTLLAMVTLDRQKGGAGPTLFSYDKTTGVTTKVGPIFDASSSLSWATGETFYFSATRPTTLYTHEGPRFMRYDVTTRASELVFDISAEFGSDKYIWQPHSSNDDRVHSFTVRRNSDYAMLGCAVYREDTRKYTWFGALADFDECQIDKSGRYLVIKEQVDGAQGEDNLIQDLATGAQRLLIDPAGAGGHSDDGFSYMVAEDNFASQPGTVRLWRLDLDPADPANGKVVFHATDWEWGSNHLAHSNAVSGLAIEQQMVCSSNAARKIMPRANEVLCYRLDGSLQVLVVAPVMTNLDAAGGGDDYRKSPKGNVDVTGEYFMWTSNMGSGRMDAFIVRVPKQLLDSTAPPPEPEPEPDPTPTPPPAPVPAAVGWTSLVNASAAGATVSKTGGCSGCPDAGALSVQEIASGDGYLEFTMSNTRALRFVGLGARNTGTTGEEIAFALRLQKGVAEVREGGTARAKTRFASGDALRIQVTGGVVSYLRNGRVFYTSQAPASYPLVADTALYDLKADVSNAVIATSSTDPTPGPTPTPSPGTPAAASWTNLINSTVSGTVLRKSAGCAGCPDAGAVALQQIAGDGGYVEFTVTESMKLRTLGLAAPGGNPIGTNLPWALRLGGGYAEVRESGGYRADVGLAVGDTLRIAISGGRITYSKNGSAFYTSGAAVSVPLSVYALFYDLDGTISDAVIAAGSN